MRIAQINLPVNGNNGESLSVVHDDLARDLARLFGGYTCTYGMGGWLNDGAVQTEPVAVYQVAFVGNVGDVETFKGLVHAAGKAAGQIAMFYVIDGEAEIVTIR